MLIYVVADARAPDRITEYRQDPEAVEREIAPSSHGEPKRNLADLASVHGEAREFKF